MSILAVSHAQHRISGAAWGADKKGSQRQKGFCKVTLLKVVTII